MSTAERPLRQPGDSPLGVAPPITALPVVRPIRPPTLRHAPVAAIGADLAAVETSAFSAEWWPQTRRLVPHAVVLRRFRWRWPVRRSLSLRRRPWADDRLRGRLVVGPRPAVPLLAVSTHAAGQSQRGDHYADSHRGSLLVTAIDCQGQMGERSSGALAPRHGRAGWVPAPIHPCGDQETLEQYEHSSGDRPQSRSRTAPGDARLHAFPSALPRTSLMAWPRLTGMLLRGHMRTSNQRANP